MGEAKIHSCSRKAIAMTARNAARDKAEPVATRRAAQKVAVIADDDPDRDELVARTPKS